VGVSRRVSTVEVDAFIRYCPTKVATVYFNRCDGAAELLLGRPSFHTRPVDWASTDMRLDFRLVLLAFGVSFGVLACSKHSGEASAGQTSALRQTQPRAGGELVFAFDGTSGAAFALDPHKSGFAPHVRIIRSLFDSLVVLLPEHRFGPWLAKSWEVSADGLDYTFHLRDDVTFHDGTRFDAEAVKFNFERIKEPKNALLASAELGPYESSTVLDPLTVRVHFTRPYAPFLTNLSKPTLGIASPAAVQKYGDQFASHPVGTGPFSLQSITTGTEISLARNAGYHWAAAGSAHDGPAWLEHLTFKNVPEEATRVAVLQNGQADAADLIPPQNVREFKSSSEFHLLEQEMLNLNYSIYLNVQREPWNDRRVREAFKRSLDLDAAVKTIYLGTTKRAWSVLSPSIFGYNQALENSWQPDPASAKRTLDELGWKPGPDGIRVKDGKRLSLVFLDTQGNREKRMDLLTLLRRQIHDTGFELRVDTEATGSYLEKAKTGDYDVLAGSLFTPDPDALRRIFGSVGRPPWTYFRGVDPELDTLLDQGASALTPEARVKSYAQAQQLIVDQVYAIPTYVLNYSVAAKNRVQGLVIDAHGFPVFSDAWLRQ